MTQLPGWGLQGGVLDETLPARHAKEEHFVVNVLAHSFFQQGEIEKKSNDQSMRPRFDM